MPSSNAIIGPCPFRFLIQLTSLPVLTLRLRIRSSKLRRVQSRPEPSSLQAFQSVRLPPWRPLTDLPGTVSATSPATDTLWWLLVSPAPRRVPRRGPHLPHTHMAIQSCWQTFKFFYGSFVYVVWKIVLLHTFQPVVVLRMFPGSIFLVFWQLYVCRCHSWITACGKNVNSSENMQHK